MALAKLILTVMTNLRESKCTIDMNIEELQYLADHLHPEECRRLFASAHFHSYDPPSDLEQAESQVPKDVPCIRLLLHWNSAVGEGKGESHDIIEHRLRQMGKQDLANWLGKTVFHQLSMELKHSLEDPFRDLKETDEPAENVTLETTTVSYDVTAWLPLDTLLLTAVAVLMAISVMVFFRVVWVVYCQRKKRKKTLVVNKTRYNELEDCTTDDEESVFDVRKKNGNMSYSD